MITEKFKAGTTIIKQKDSSKDTIGYVKTGAQVKDINCPEDSEPPTSMDTNFVSKRNITLSNGVEIAGLGHPFHDANLANYIEEYIDICIDTNGPAGPNKGCEAANTLVENRDRFRIRIYYTGKVTVDSSWNFENAILGTIDNPADLKSKDYPDVTP